MKQCKTVTVLVAGIAGGLLYLMQQTPYKRDDHLSNGTSIPEYRILDIKEQDNMKIMTIAWEYRKNDSQKGDNMKQADPTREASVALQTSRDAKSLEDFLRGIIKEEKR